jgi:hypothetical protein
MAKSVNKSQMLQLGAFQKLHKWDIEIIRRPFIPNIISGDTIRFLATSIDIPKPTMEQIEFNKQGIKWKEIGNVDTSGDWKFTTLELENSPIRSFITAYRNAMKSGTLSRKDSSMDLKLTSKTAAEKENMIYTLKYFQIIDTDIPTMGGEIDKMEITISGHFMDFDERSI